MATEKTFENKIKSILKSRGSCKNTIYNRLELPGESEFASIPADGRDSWNCLTR